MMNLLQSPLIRKTEPPARLANRLASWNKRFERIVDKLLPDAGEQPDGLHEAMRYAALAGSKRFRPLLVYAAGQSLGLPPERLDRTAAAIEIIHTYSLIHDDLPAMDDDELRRGKPSLHRAFDEATAILAGDALQALAFEVLAQDDTISPEVGLDIVRQLAHACGSMGMAGGQILDLAAVGKTLSLEELETMHRLKTGALIQVCVTAPARIAAVPPRVLDAMRRFGEHIGLAFQIQDDILDVVGDSEVTGKPSQADAEKDKPTFPAIIGLEASRRRAVEQKALALKALEPCPGDHESLRWLAHYVVERDR